MSKDIDYEDLYKDKLLKKLGVEDDEIPIQQMSYKEIAHKSWDILLNSLSVAFSVLLQILFLTINLHYAVELNDIVVQDALGLANLTANCCGGMFIVGMNQGFGSLLGRAHGAGSDKLKINYLNKGFWSMMGVFGVLFLLILNTETIFVALGQHAEVARLCQYYLIRISPGLFFFYLFDLMRNLLNAQNINKETLVFMSGSVLLHLFLCKTLLEVSGLSGIITAMNISNFVMFATGVWFINKTPSQKKLIKLIPYEQVKQNFNIYFKQCLYITLPIFIDYFAFELNSILVGYLKDIEQFGAHVAICNYQGVLYSLPFGVSGSLVYRVSAACGERKVQKAKNYYYFSLILSVVTGLFEVIFTVLFMPEIAAFYTGQDQETIQNYIQQILSLFVWFYIIDHAQVSTSGIAKGMDLSNKVLHAYLISFYLVGTPISLLLGFAFDLQLLGFWIGFMFAIVSIFSLLQYYLTRLDWVKQVDHIVEKINADRQEDLKEMQSINE